MKPVTYTEGQAMGLHEVLAHYENWLPRPNNYVRIARQYLEFLIEKDFSINALSAERFVAQRSLSYHSAIKKFLQFAAQSEIKRVYPDERPKYSGHPTVLRFLAESQLRPNSKDTYAKALDELYKFLESQQLPFNRISVLKFIEYHQAQQHSPYTINTYLAAIRRYVGFCIVRREQLNISEDIANHLRDIVSIRSLQLGGTVRTYTKDSLTAEERDFLLSVIDNPRDRLIIGLMAYQGLRSVEVIRLDWDDFKKFSGKKYIAVLGKGRNEKEFIPLLVHTEELLKQYREVSERRKGQLFDFQTTAMIRRITNHWLTLSGLKRDKLSAHSLRHTTAQLMLDQGIPKEMVQRFLRHKSVATTSLYTAKQEDRVFLSFDFG